MEEIPRLIELQAALANRDVVLLGIGVREKARPLRDLMTRRNITYPLLLDEHGDIAKLYNLAGVPRVIAVDRNGIVRHDAVALPRDVETLLKRLESAAGE